MGLIKRFWNKLFHKNVLETELKGYRPVMYYRTGTKKRVRKICYNLLRTRLQIKGRLPQKYYQMTTVSLMDTVKKLLKQR